MLLPVGEERDHFGYDPIRDRKTAEEMKETKKLNMVRRAIIFGMITALAYIIIYNTKIF